jgi:hypothetical protein
MLAKTRFITAAVTALALAACSDDGTGPNDDGNSMDATIAGEPGYNPPSASIVGTYNNNVLAIEGASTTGDKTVTIKLNLPGLTSTGTVTLNQNVGGQFAQVLVLEDGQISTWSTADAPGTGTVNITTLTSSRAAGTFSFTGQAITNNPATGTKAVTNGSFDIEF